jgi:hypothetical protein
LEEELETTFKALSAKKDSILQEDLRITSNLSNFREPLSPIDKETPSPSKWTLPLKTRRITPS